MEENEIEVVSGKAEPELGGSNTATILQSSRTVSFSYSLGSFGIYFRTRHTCPELLKLNALMV